MAQIGKWTHYGHISIGSTAHKRILNSDATIQLRCIKPKTLTHPSAASGTRIRNYTHFSPLNHRYTHDVLSENFIIYQDYLVSIALTSGAM